ncbi:hypothetical protein AVEN_244365-1 [Araneus ventricosus]|uniref:Uncharacterized protein n=1 Tax=Araneus ventricosus TaxID=182803 RepID=A0A4Y2PTM5_ARAVE|nr:hypothetical protein AVEN_244365-1 [Araneus ventricosus]
MSFATTVKYQLTAAFTAFQVARNAPDGSWVTVSPPRQREWVGCRRREGQAAVAFVIISLLLMSMPSYCRNYFSLPDCNITISRHCIEKATSDAWSRPASRNNATPSLPP